METLAKWTVDDSHRMIASSILDNRCVELLAGEIHMAAGAEDTSATLGIQEYWILYLTMLQLIVFRDPRENNYQSRQDIKAGIVCPLALPEITISVEQFNYFLFNGDCGVQSKPEFVLQSDELTV